MSSRPCKQLNWISVWSSHEGGKLVSSVKCNKCGARLLDKVNPEQLKYKIFKHFSSCPMTSVGGLTAANLQRREELREAERVYVAKVATKRLNRGGFSIEQLKALAAENGEDVQKYLYDIGSKPSLTVPQDLPRLRERPQSLDNKPDVSIQRGQSSKARSPRMYNATEEDVKESKDDIIMAPLQVKDYVWPEGLRPEQLPNGYVVPQEEALARAQKRSEAAAREAAQAERSTSEDEDAETADVLLARRRKSRRITNKIRGAELPYLELVDLDARLPHQKKPTWRNNDKHESLEDLMNDLGLNFPAEACKAVRDAKIQSVKQLSVFSPHWWKFFCGHMIQGLSDQQQQDLSSAVEQWLISLGRLAEES